jgi:O-antigen/teichoic acid export membrane protein
MSSVLVLDVAVSALQISGLLILKSRGHLTGSRALGVIGVSCAVIAGLALVAMRSQFAPSRSRAVSDWRLNWSFGKWSFAAQLAYWAMVYSIPWILAILAGTDATGRFAACSSLVMIANPLLIGLNNFLAPQAVHSYHSDGLSALCRLTLRATLLMTAALSLLAAGLILFSDKLLMLVYGRTVADGNWVVAILAISLLFTAQSIGVDNGLLAFGRLDTVFKSCVAGLIATLISGCFLISTHGVIGAAIATVIGQFVATTYKFALFAIVYREKRQASRTLPLGA